MDKPRQKVRGLTCRIVRNPQGTKRPWRVVGYIDGRLWGILGAYGTRRKAEAALASWVEPRTFAA
jgi:hypothetical protein